MGKYTVLSIRLINDVIDDSGRPTKIIMPVRQETKNWEFELHSYGVYCRTTKDKLFFIPAANIAFMELTERKLKK